MSPRVAMPSWTAGDGRSTKHQGIWPLGLDRVGFWLSDPLFYGITNQTPRVRYYSFFCWAFWTYAEHCRRTGEQPTRIAQRAWLHRLEAAFRLATQRFSAEHPHLLGVRGGASLPEDPNARIAIDDDEGASAFVPAAYSASFQFLKLGSTADSVVGLTGSGIRLAQSFEAAVLASGVMRPALQRLLDPGRPLMLWELDELLPGFRLGSVPHGSPEFDVLLDVLTHIDRGPNDRTSTALDQARSRNMTLVLDLIGSSKGTLESTQQLHRLFSAGRFRDNRGYDAPAIFRDDWLRWRRFQERQHENVALYSLWAAVLLLVGKGLREPDRLYDRLTDLGARSETLRAWAGEDALKVKLPEFERRMSREFERRKGADGFTPDDLARELQDLVGQPELVSEWIGAALVLLALTMWKWERDRSELPDWAVKLHSAYGRERLALNVVLEDRDRFHARRAGDYLHWVIETYVVQQSFLIAGQKLLRGDYRFFLTQGDDGLELVKETSLTEYASYGNPRIYGAVNQLRDLELITAGSPLRLTPAGEETLLRLLEFHGRTAQDL